jgi:hypothetical protein
VFAYLGLVSTIAGSGVNGKIDGICTIASFGVLNGITLNTAGFLFVSDKVSKNIRMINYLTGMTLSWLISIC